MATAGRIQSDVMCPFFVRESSAEHKIVCEGSGKSTFAVCYASSDDKNRVAYLQKYCQTGKYQDCPICKYISGEKYDDGHKLELEEKEAKFLELLRKIASGKIWYYNGQFEILEACRKAAEVIVEKNREIMLLAAGKPLNDLSKNETDIRDSAYLKGYNKGYEQGRDTQRRRGRKAP